MTELNHSPFHKSEVAVQNRFGLAESLAHRYKNFIRTQMPDQHRRFFESQDILILGMTDIDGNVWCFPVFGGSGFTRSPTADSLVIKSTIALSNTVAFDVGISSKIGILGLEHHTRRRNRVNGTISRSLFSVSEASSSSTSPPQSSCNERPLLSELSVKVEQSYGNCPQYIHRRQLIPIDVKSNDPKLSTINERSGLTKFASLLIEHADTFYIASRTKQFTSDHRSGLDASHRGGVQGFVKVHKNTLIFPDFSGNQFFNTIGNIVDDGRVGLFFPDYETGNALFISGVAEIVWDESLLGMYPGAQRFVKVACERVIEASNYLPFEHNYLDNSPSFDGSERWNIK